MDLGPKVKFLGTRFKKRINQRTIGYVSEIYLFSLFTLIIDDLPDPLRSDRGPKSENLGEDFEKEKSKTTVRNETLTELRHSLTVIYHLVTAEGNGFWT